MLTFNVNVCGQHACAGVEFVKIFKDCIFGKVIDI